MSAADKARAADECMVWAARELERAGKQIRAADYAKAIGTLTDAIEWAEDARLAAVQAYRAGGHSWTEVGEALGMSKQAAWGKYSGRLE